MEEKIYLTSEIARAVNVHPNTVRMYEKWGLISPARRTPSGYRQFTEAHLFQMRLARLVFRCTWIGGEIRRAAVNVVYNTAAGSLEAAFEEAQRFYRMVEEERSHADAAAAYLENWAAGDILDVLPKPVRIGEAARLLNSTVDSLRSWERNGLIEVPRDPQSGYRLYRGREIGRLRVIRMLLLSGYSAMAVLRMVHQLDHGHKTNLREILDTPRPDEDVLSASDHWLSSLAEMKETAAQIIDLLNEFRSTLAGRAGEPSGLSSN
jgi:DNA-binding transcriptional MerR regulator